MSQFTPTLPVSALVGSSYDAAAGAEKPGHKGTGPAAGARRGFAQQDRKKSVIDATGEKTLVVIFFQPLFTFIAALQRVWRRKKDTAGVQPKFLGNAAGG